MAKLKAFIRIDDGPVIPARNLEARTIFALVKARVKVITSLAAFLVDWAVCLATHIFEFKAKSILIRSTCETHDGGNQARNFLARPVQLMAVIGPTKSKMAVQA